MTRVLIHKTLRVFYIYIPGKAAILLPKHFVIISGHPADVEAMNEED